MIFKIRRNIIWVFYVIILLFLCVYLFPLLWILLTSIRTRQDTLTYPPVWIFKPTLEEFIYTLKSKEFLIALFNSVYVGFTSTAVVLVMAVPAAYALARFTFKGRDDIGFYIISTKMTPPIIVLFAFYLMFSKLGLLRTRTGVIILHIALNLPFAIWLIKGFFENIPREIEESAQIDGCNEVMVIRRITLPMTYPGILVTAVLCLMFSWMEFIFVSTITDPTTATVPVYIYRMIAYLHIEWGKAAAAGIIYIVPMLAICLAIRNRLVRGLSFGLIK